MVDRDNLTEATQLNFELQHIERALINLENGGRITSMVITSGPEQQAAIVNTNYIDYPLSMVEAIKALLQGRKQYLLDELEALGVTNLDAPPNGNLDAPPNGNLDAPPSVRS